MPVGVACEDPVAVGVPLEEPVAVGVPLEEPVAVGVELEEPVAVGVPWEVLVAVGVACEVAVAVGGGPPGMPVPERFTICLPPGPGPANTNIALRLPVALGSNVTETLQLPAAATDPAQVSFSTKSPASAPIIEITTFIASEVLFVTDTGCGVLGLLVGCLGNTKDFGVRVSNPSLMIPVRVMTVGLCCMVLELSVIVSVPGLVPGTFAVKVTSNSQCTPGLTLLPQVDETANGPVIE